jgi:hypothetical protein
MTDKFEIACSAMHESFHAARAARPDRVHEDCYILAGRPAKVRVVGDQLAEHLCLAFKHLEANDTTAPAQLTVEFWDESETGILCPMRTLLEAEWGTHAVTLARSIDDRFFASKLRQSMTCLDRKTRRIFGCSFQPEQFSLYERGRPLHMPLSVWHFDRNVPIIHAALVSKEGKGVLFAGNSGTGKTTSAISCLRGAFDYLSEDQVALEDSNDGCFIGHSLYNSTFLERDDLQRFPFLAAHTIKGIYPDEEKVLVLLSKLFPSRTKGHTRISAVVLPRIVKGGVTRYRTASRTEALLALAPSSLIVGQLSSGIHGFRKLSQLVEQVPCYWLEVGPEVHDIPLRVEEILAHN